jgi:quercetin dioxygenase-like cupin family protein
MAQAATVQGGVRLGSGEGRAFWLLNDRHTFKATADDTGGALTVAELTAASEISPPPHVHRQNDECFYVIEGTFEFTLAGDAFVAGPGGFVLLPKGIVHSHRAAGGPARALVIQSPGGVERFIEAAGRPVAVSATPPPPPSLSDFQRIVAVAHAHGIDVPGAILET